jgi:hypothetical protein
VQCVLVKKFGGKAVRDDPRTAFLLFPSPPYLPTIWTSSVTTLLSSRILTLRQIPAAAKRMMQTLAHSSFRSTSFNRPSASVTAGADVSFLSVSPHLPSPARRHDSEFNSLTNQKKYGSLRLDANLTPPRFV